ncbi:MAG TPA: zf-HC2 domain-containing protein [Methylomirabilota bacterium]|jgi:anti-sigma factor RsiW|nr:zf-HC2 domain-containing protein [Methylomirabilota bacterium]
MTNSAACPDQLLLSQFLDQELEEKENYRITRHLTHCPDCQAQIERLRHTDRLIRSQLPESPLPLPSLSPACPPLDGVVAYMQGSLPAPEAQQIEQHIQHCETCFTEAKEAARIAVFLKSPQTPPVPISVKTKVFTPWETSVSLPRLVLQMTAQGLRLIESYLIPPLLDVQEVFTPLATFRGGRTSSSAFSGERSSALTLRLQAGEVEMDVLAIPEHDGVAVRLTLFDAEHTALANRRIFIRQQGRAIFSAQTDEQGGLHVPRLDPGAYEVSCHEIHTAFQLELRP